MAIIFIHTCTCITYINTFISEEEPFPADEEEDSPFGNKGGLFSGSKGLFDDSEEDEVRVNYNK